MRRAGVGLVTPIGATALTLAAALAAAAAGHVAVGFVLFVASASPLPALASGSLARWIHGR
jgi:hypothetical protein